MTNNSLKIRRVKFVLLFIAALLFFLVLYVLYRPRPIIPAGEHCTILRVQVNTDGLPADCYDYDEDAILSILSSSYEQRTTEKAGSFSMGDVDVAVMFMTEAGSKEVLLGRINYSYYANGRPKYRIIDAQEVERRLLEALAHEV